MTTAQEILEDDEVKVRDRDKNIPYVDLREGARGILTWAQVNGNTLSTAALELIGEAKRVSIKLDDDSRKITTIVIGKQVRQFAETLIYYGADEVLVVEDERIPDYLTLPYSRAIISAIKKIKPEIMLFSASSLGRDLAPRVASILDLGLSADCTGLDVGYYVSRKRNQRFAKAFKMIRPSFGESKLATIVGPWRYPVMATARPGVFSAMDPDFSRTGKITAFTPDWEDIDFSIELLEVVRKEDTVNLEKADIIVTGGIGVSKDGFNKLKELVDAINANGQLAELGSSRAAVDAGLVSHSRQVGQTGKTVRPQYYIAVGVSGSVQHVAGMKDSERIIAINNDPDANIWDIADEGILADYEEVIPILLDRIKNGYTFKLK